jgi:hypothetical protein
MTSFRDQSNVGETGCDHGNEQLPSLSKKENMNNLSDATRSKSNTSYGQKVSRGTGHWFRKTVGGFVRDMTSVTLTAEESTQKANDMMEIQRLQNELGIDSKKKKKPHQKCFQVAKKIFGPPSEKSSVKLERLQHTQRFRALRTPDGSEVSSEELDDQLALQQDQSEVINASLANSNRSQDQEVDCLSLPNLTDSKCSSYLLPSSMVTRDQPLLGTSQLPMIGVDTNTNHCKLTKQMYLKDSHDNIHRA